MTSPAHDSLRRGSGLSHSLMSDLANESVGENIAAISLDLSAIKRELIEKCIECQQRGLLHNHKWMAELAHALEETKVDLRKCALGLPTSEIDFEEYDTYTLCKGYFDIREYDRCGYFSKEAKSPKLVFLHFYSRYLSSEKKRLDSLTDKVKNIYLQGLGDFKELKSDMEKYQINQTFDGYCLYLYGVLLKRLGLASQAKLALCEALRAEPCQWNAWIELSSLVEDSVSIEKLELPDHWMKHFFLAHTFLEKQMIEKARIIYIGLCLGGLNKSTYIFSQLAILYHNMREVEQAILLFKELSERDPYRLDNLDTYSNLLYVQGERVALSHLAHKACQIDKYRPETCCVIANYYSLRTEHEKAITYFQRALKLNPNYLAAWTLMGHEFVELKNTNAAIQSYRNAIEVNKRDYRAWYGLGQTYEMLKMYNYCMYYYSKAHDLRPEDSRMLVALGECYDKLDKPQEAMKCFGRAHSVGDIENGIALYHLGRMHEKLGDEEQAAAAYHRYIHDMEEQSIQDRDPQSRAFRFLAHYHKAKDNLDEAQQYAHKCQEFPDVREEARALLREIANRRSTQPAAATNTVMSTTAASIFNVPTETPQRDLEPMHLTYDSP